MQNKVLSRFLTVCLAFVMLWLAEDLSAQERNRGAVFETETHRFLEVAPGVHFVTGTGKVFTSSNALVIVSSADAIAVDSHVTAMAAQALVSSVKQLTDKSVRFLINTHFHFDHVHGNEGFPAGVNIVGHEVTRERLLEDPLRDPIYLNSVARWRDTIKELKTREAAGQDGEERQRLETVLERATAHPNSLVETRPVAPDITLNRRLTIHRDGRPIEVIFLGRGHTGGDVVVYLPRERVLFTGDLLMPMPSYMGDGYIDEWIAALQKLEELDFDLILPGHGEPFRDRTYIHAFQKVLSSLWDQLAELRKHGMSPAEAIKKVDLSEPLSFYDPNVIPNHMRELDPRIAARVYERLEELERSGSSH